MDSLNDILSSLSPDDINSLKSIADSVFGNEEKQKSQPLNDLFSGISPEMLMQISGVMSAMNSGSNERCRLIEALKPNLSRARQKKADEAMQLLKIMDIIPVLNLLKTDGDSNGNK